MNLIYKVNYENWKNSTFPWHKFAIVISKIIFSWRKPVTIYGLTVNKINSFGTNLIRKDFRSGRGKRSARNPETRKCRDFFDQNSNIKKEKLSLMKSKGIGPKNPFGWWKKTKERKELFYLTCSLCQVQSECVRKRKLLVGIQ